MAVKDVVFGSIIGCKKQKAFFHLLFSLLLRLSNQNSLIINQFAFKSRNPFSKANIHETEKNSKLKRTDVFNKRIVTYTANQLKVDAKTIKGNWKHA